MVTGGFPSEAVLRSSGGSSPGGGHDRLCMALPVSVAGCARGGLMVRAPAEWFVLSRRSLAGRTSGVIMLESAAPQVSVLPRKPQARRA